MFSAATSANADLIFKVVVSGPYSAGKTTFISTVAGQSLVTTDEDVTAAIEAERKSATTVGMDFGVFVVPDEAGDIELRLHGTPGQERFRFMWEILAEGADAFVIMLDGRTPHEWAEARSHITTLRGVQDAPGVIAVNWYSEGDIVDRVREEFSDTGFAVVACDAREPGDVLGALVEVLTTTLERLEAETVSMAGAVEWH
ncbi:MAG: ATP/GTP-binding protein [Actinomycetota bacterium]